MRKFGFIIAPFVLALALAGCGGDNGNCSEVGGGSTGSTSCTSKNTTPSGSPEAVAVTIAPTSIPSDGSSAGTITATVTDINGAPVANEIVTFSTSAGALSAVTATTNASGQVTDSVTASGVTGGTTITVSASAGSALGRGTVTVTTAGSKAASLTVSSSVASIPVDGSSTATITVLAKDANNNAVSGVPVTLAASAGTLTVAGATTGANGTITATLSGAGVKAGTTITITATAGTTTGQTTVIAGSGGTTQESITAMTSLPQIPSDGSKIAVITAVLRDSNNNLVPGVTVSFSATSGGLQVTQAVTDATGSAKATLSPANDPSNRTITVTASAQGQSATVPVSVTGTTLAVTGPTNLVQGAQGAFSVSLTNSAGTGISNQAVTITSKNGNTLSTNTLTTNSTGAAQFQLTATNSGTDTISAAGLGLTAQTALSVSNQSFSFTAPAANATINVNTPTTVTISWTAVTGGTPVGQNGTVALTSSRGTLSASTATVTNGTITLPASVTISSTTAGPAIISATALNSSNAVVATAQVVVNFIATTPAAVSLQASPSTVQIQGQSTITATVTDPTGNPVQGQTVNFTLTDSTGGSLSSPAATTNSEGQASITYTASSGSSTPNGVLIAGTVGTSNITNTTTLTVGGQAVFLSLGTGNLITAYSATQYEWPYTVQAADAAGNGVSNVTVTFKVQSLAYAPGQMSWSTGTTFPAYSAQGTLVAGSKVLTLTSVNAGETVVAGTELVDVDGSIPANTTIVQQLSGTSGGAGTYQMSAAAATTESTAEAITGLYIQPASTNWLSVQYHTAFNENYIFTGFCAPTSVLEYNGVIDPNPTPTGVTGVETAIPGSVVTTDVGSATTGVGGTATVNLIYPKDHAYWVAVALTATATVAGTQSSTSASFVLLGIASDYNNVSTSPPGQISPYGVATSCY